MSKYGVMLFTGVDEADHPAELLRTLIYAAFRGQEGWLTQVAGRGETLAIPGPGVRVLPGPFVVNSRFPGGQLQAYMSGIINDEEVPTTTVPSGWSANGGYRYDLVVANIEDPGPSNGAQWPIPNTSEGRRFGPYWNMRVIENVPANCVAVEQIPANHPSGARGWTALPSMRLKRPAGTATVTAEMITRLNVTCNPFTGITLPPDLSNELDSLEDIVSGLIDKVNGIGTGIISVPWEFTNVNDVLSNKSSNVLNRNTTSYKRFPEEASWDLFVPPQATNVDVFFIASGVYQKATETNKDANILAKTIFKLSLVSNPGTEIYSEDNTYDMDEINSADNRPPAPGDSTNVGTTTQYRPGNRPPIVTIQNFNVPSSMRGKKVRLEHMMRMLVDATKNTNGRLICDTATNMYVALKWKEK